MRIALAAGVLFGVLGLGHDVDRLAWAQRAFSGLLGVLLDIGGGLQ